MSTDEVFAQLRARGVTAEGARRFADGSAENLDPEALAALTEANLTEAQLHDYVTQAAE
ncbi:MULTISPECIES: hypothetical protein [unclassified Rhodococcus (in: high G+C Gram-positive bacteria)]|uniref:hypothetical protein n=1 Tax=unclassified Rhodococcus (in: high G+C Gram-positive bacteria) TaxID=192944 RepID=UPI000AEE6CFD|nr:MULTISPECIES: hypothetical protein [unclassified Rhodococcus (in: high G+C Gram-positive bacteria)]MBY6678551.1 hypothetical protein [Rhodococcus sp. BP-332]MBY6682082.1 hypothetical protein [Rhodococcus sp. BP-316]MBY6686758.1 hypothetical protein [Rhodococcus sp. BP-288]MBY6695620.1 hypothetical protein [Rhodococcus sp. BP-188]MBY6700250.1 hypothetical protein [Rhodococcus sp. BP-285]